MGDKKFFDKNFNSKAAQIAGEEISKIDSCDVIPPVQMLQILRVLNERRRQDAKWGGAEHDDMHSRYEWENVLCRIVEEAIRNPVTDEDVVEALVEVAAVAVAWLEAIERRKAEQR